MISKCKAVSHFYCKSLSFDLTFGGYAFLY